jgi:hypothetical protein
MQHAESVEHLGIEELVARLAVDALHVAVLTWIGLASVSGEASGQLVANFSNWAGLVKLRSGAGRISFSRRNGFSSAAASICRFRLRLIYRASVDKPVPVSSAVSRWLLPFTRTS